MMSAEAGDVADLHLNPGIYIIQVGDKAEKIVILETDKWDEIIFSDFKRTFENLAEKFNIKFKFRFFTEDGKKIVWFAP